jgi:transposase, IS5 family
MKRYKKHRDYGFFDQDIRLTKLTQLGDPLDKLLKHVDFELFRPLLEEKLTKLAKAQGGRPPYDYVLMLKILILQRFYNLSDHQTEYQINDRMSFMRFLNLTIADDIPDEKTIWNFKAQLIDLELVEALFKLFLDQLKTLGLVANEGKIVDASFIEVPIQRNTKAENEQLKQGEIPQDFSTNPHRLAQKDTDARWTKKGNVSYYGYKNHIKADQKSKLIVSYAVTRASLHDSQALSSVLEERAKDEVFYADSAYVGPDCEKLISDCEMVNAVCERAYRNKALSEAQVERNRAKSRIRSRVEHIFGFMEMSMTGMYLYSIGLKRVSGGVGLMNLTYNLFRRVQLASY